MENQIDENIRQVYSVLLSKPGLRNFVDTRHRIPKTYCGDGQIKLIIVGQDPTVKNRASRKNITTVLNLDKPGKLQRYIHNICSLLGIDPKRELYGTNLLKNFFDDPPAENRPVLGKFAQLWLPVLKKELSCFPDSAVITLGEPLLDILVNNSSEKLVRNYWGYTEDWEKGDFLAFDYCKAENNILGRDIFPFPHQPSIVKGFYSARLPSYAAYMKEIITDVQK